VQIAILLFEGITPLDAVGPYEALRWLPGAETVFVGHRVGPVRSEGGRLGLVVDAELADVPHPDVVLVPGGPGQASLMTDAGLHDWLRAVDATSTWTTSVCTGSLVLAAAGLLTGRKATTYWLALEQLGALGAVPTAERVVVDGKYVTAAGVSAGIDMALTLAARIAGDTVAQTVQLGIEYDPHPPFDAGSPRTAPPAVVDTLRSRSRFIVPSLGAPAL
jgi:putative intracellular protease/amidase